MLKIADRFVSARWFRATLLIAMIGGFLLSACDQKVASKSLLKGDAAEQSVKKIAAKLKVPVRVLSVEITDSSVTLQAQDPANAAHVDAYVYSIPTGRLGQLGADWMSGPTPVELNLINPRLEENLFNLDEVDFSRMALTISEAVERAGLEDAAEVKSIRIKRRLTLLPTAQSGAVEWQLEIRSGRESAEAYADAKGNIRRMDVSQTRRAQTLDMMAGGQPVRDAIAEIRDFFGAGAVLKKASFSRMELSIVARKTGQPPTTSEPYYWDSNGLTHSLGPLIKMPNQQDQEEDFYSVDEVDWSKLTKLTAMAIEKTGIQGGRITGVYVERVEPIFPKRPVQWRITVEPGASSPFGMNREEGTSFFSAQGELIRVELPKSRQVLRDFRTVDTMRSVLPEFRGSFGNEARYMELSFDDRTCRILAPGPKKPEQIQAFNYDQDHFSGMAGMDETAFYKGFKNDWMFSLDDLDKSVLPVLAERQKDTLAKLRMPEGKITRVTFHRYSPFYPGNKKLLIEIRATGKAGDGYVVYDQGGGVLDVITP